MVVYNGGRLRLIEWLKWKVHEEPVAQVGTLIKVMESRLPGTFARETIGDNKARENHEKHGNREN